MSPRRTEDAVAGTRSEILSRSVALASIEGLEGLTIGRLAEDVGMSKSGLIGHFGSREQLQLATLEAAIDRFTAAVWTPVANRTPGLPRLRALISSWLRYARGDTFPGGCFLSAASLEFDDRPGPVRDLVAASMQRWVDLLRREAATARDAGDITTDVDPAQLAFEIQALLMAANWANRLLHDRQAFTRARRSITGLLDAAAA